MARELIPFIQGIQAGVPLIMIAHMAVPGLDATQAPASLSHRVVSGLLRQELGYENLVITDCLEMEGIQSSYSTSQAVRQAFQAGVDLLCISHSPERQEEGIRALYDDAHRGILSEARIDQSLKRIHRYKSQLPQGRPPRWTGWDRQELQALQEVSDQSLTLGRNQDFFGPQGLADSPRLLILHLRRPEQFIGENTIAGGPPIRILQEAFPLATFRTLHPEELTQKDRQIDPSSWEKVFILCSDLFPHKEARELVKDWTEAGPPVGIAVMRTPYEAGWFPQARGLVLLYEDSPQAYRSLVRFLKGDIPPRGVLPVTIPGL